MVWSLRLTHSYFRREGWAFGSREDWRFSDMRKKYGRQWWWASFFLAYLSQHLMLVGLVLPVYTVHFGPSASTPWSHTEVLVVVLCLAGIICAYHADTTLHEFVIANARRKEEGKPKVLLLCSGLW
eukprot:CAMPEP_0113944806 /NCGR_PEP_ID=MMETSP1339-20121228/36941_1 /TAXON_ID=94617 /ORGANISM="Fibrocapsa japonica" /LENGTH=125 /DNA_ID=CAMNT_0000950127 /DNA_START=400 /DNA_END=774 /DNA_ORIENTATION=+ /assembly_acc=CAM_ASM_000762